MAELSKEFWDVVNEHTLAHIDDVPAAIRAAENAIRHIPNFAALVSDLITEAVQNAVYACRTKNNLRIKNRICSQNPVNVLRSRAVQEVHDSVYSLVIAGRTLGSIPGEEIQDIAIAERQRAAGHTANALLLEWLTTQVPNGRTVQECVSETKLTKQVRKFQNQVRATDEGAA